MQLIPTDSKLIDLTIRRWKRHFDCLKTIGDFKDLIVIALRMSFHQTLEDLEENEEMKEGERENIDLHRVLRKFLRHQHHYSTMNRLCSAGYRARHFLDAEDLIERMKMSDDDEG